MAGYSPSSSGNAREYDGLAPGDGSAGEFMSTDGSNAAWSGAPNSPNWSEDGNSPFNASGSNSHTYTIDGTDYDHVLFMGTVITSGAGGSQDINLRMNGETGSNYEARNTAGSTVSGADKMTLQRTVQDGASVLCRITLQQQVSNSQLSVFNQIAATETDNYYLYGGVGNQSTDLSEFTIYGGGSGTLSIDGRVYGWSV